MRNYTQYFDDPEEEDRFNLEQMNRFAGGGVAPRPQLSENDFLFDDGPDQQQQQFNQERAMPPEPDAERAAPILEGRSPAAAGPSPRMLEDDAVRAVRDSYGKKRGFFEDAAPAAIALGLDALLNKSRGAGAIAGGYSQGVMRRDQDDKDSMRQMAQLEIMRARENAQDQYRQQNYELGGRNADLRQGELEEARARRLKQGAGLNELQQSQADLDKAQAWKIYNTDPNALTPAQQAMNEDRDAARTMHKDELDARNADRDEQRKMRLTMTNQQNYDKWKGAKETRDKEDRLATESFNEKTKSARDVARSVQEAERVLTKYPATKNPLADDIPGIGPIQGRLPASFVMNEDRRMDSETLDRMRRQANQSYKVLKTGLAAPIAEAEDIQMANGFNEGSTEEQFRSGMTALGGVMKRELRARATASPVNARKALAAEGLDSWVGGWGADSEEQPYPEFKPLALEAEQVPTNPGARMPDDRTTPGPDQLEPVQRLGGQPGPTVRGTVGFPGSGSPEISNPTRNKQLDDDRKRIQRGLQSGGVDFRWEE